ncbi:MAG: hypothetical protein CVU74_03990, partial [Deltaproteobacteria bacterium HGW-Deltaproteobacteria-9]
ALPVPKLKIPLTSFLRLVIVFSNKWRNASGNFNRVLFGGSGMNDFLKRRVDLNLKARKGERR